MKNAKVAFIGGDLRQIRVINQMALSGKRTGTFGFGEETFEKFKSSVQKIKSLDELLEEYNIYVLPLPYTIDGENINMPFSKEKISVVEIIKRLPQKSLVLVGRCDERLKTMAEIYGLCLVDYFCREELQILNAIPTAEGAIQIAMEETPHTLHNSRCLIIGNGRIGKVLAKMLWGIGARVTVSARKCRDLAQICSFGYENISIWDLRKHIGEFDVIFNTVPSLVLDADLLSKVNRKCLIIDLASKPGGVDFDTAKLMGIKVIWALSLPGKVAPETAGDIIKNTLLNIFEEMEV